MSKAPTRRDLVIVVNPGSTSTKVAIYRGPICWPATYQPSERGNWPASRACPARRFGATRPWRSSSDEGSRPGSLRGGGRPRRAH